MKALVQEAAQTYEQPEAVVRWHYEKPERLNEFEALAVEHNVVDWVLGAREGGGRADDVRGADGHARCRRGRRRASAARTPTARSRHVVGDATVAHFMPNSRRWSRMTRSSRQSALQSIRNVNEQRGNDGRTEGLGLSPW